MRQDCLRLQPCLLLIFICCPVDSRCNCSSFCLQENDNYMYLRLGFIRPHNQKRVGLKINIYLENKYVNDRLIDIYVHRYTEIDAYIHNIHRHIDRKIKYRKIYRQIDKCSLKKLLREPQKKRDKNPQKHIAEDTDLTQVKTKQNMLHSCIDGYIYFISFIPMSYQTHVQFS